HNRREPGMRMPALRRQHDHEQEIGQLKNGEGADDSPPQPRPSQAAQAPIRPRPPDGIPHDHQTHNQYKHGNSVGARPRRRTPSCPRAGPTYTDRPTLMRFSLLTLLLLVSGCVERTLTVRTDPP